MNLGSLNRASRLKEAKGSIGGFLKVNLEKFIVLVELRERDPSPKHPQRFESGIRGQLDKLVLVLVEVADGDLSQEQP